VDHEVMFTREAGVDATGVLDSRGLIDASGDADRLVVGSRGRGAVAAAMLGSVSQACVRHARCPVVVVPDRGGGEQSEHAPASAAAGR
jgi:nucleotide-binding universal stress UspA family protein